MFQSCGKDNAAASCVSFQHITASMHTIIIPMLAIMKIPMIRLDVQRFGILELRHFVADFSGTLAEDGVLLPGIKEKLRELSEHLAVPVITSDTFGKTCEELRGVPCRIQELEGHQHLSQKETSIASLGSDTVVALGNGNNDTGMLRAARLGICVCLKKGCSVAALTASGVLVRSPIDAVDLLLNPKRLTATRRMLQWYHQLINSRLILFISPVNVSAFSRARSA